MLQQKPQSFGHLMRRAVSSEKTLMLGKIEGRRRRGQQRWDGWMSSLPQWTWIWASSRRWWRTGKPGMLQSMESQRVRHNWATEHHHLWSINLWPKGKNVKWEKSLQQMGLGKLDMSVQAELLQSCPTLLQRYGLYPTRLLCPWDSPGKNTGVGFYAFLQGIFQTQELLCLLHCRQILYCWATGEPPELSYDLAIPLRGIHLEKTLIQKSTCTLTFIVALFTTGKTWKQPKCPLTDKWIKKMWHIYTMEY